MWQVKADELERKMYARGLNQSSLAKLAGVDRTVINQGMTGRRYWTFDTVVRVQQALDRLPELPLPHTTIAVPVPRRKTEVA